MKIPVYQQGKGGKELVPVYSFPFGKLDPDEDAATCAARKVEEETGYQIQGHFDPNKFFEAKVLLI